MTKVKVCGITNADDARHAVRLDAWAIGLIFDAESPRACDPATAEAIGAELKRSAEVTGIFVNAPLDEVATVADRCSLSMLQLHGDEGPAYCREAARRTGCRVMKAARVKDGASLRALEPYHVDFHLVDAHVHGKPGGTGESFDWELVRERRHPVPLVLSGGLTPDNVARGVRAVRPFAVDTASGTETEPGRKDPAKLEAFFAAVRGVPAGQAVA
jgi:phosphoribosylanthranilate isomerase